MTSYGRIKSKQTMKPNGALIIKPEHSEISRLQIEKDLSANEIRNIIKESMTDFVPFEDWKWYKIY